MEKSTDSDGKTLLLKIAKKLTESQQELDEFAVQLSLGKAEATEKFEEIKKEFSARLATLKQLIKTDNADEILEKLKAKLAALELELASGKTETKSSFELQRKKILTAILAFENDVKLKIADNLVINEVVNELEKFKLKLEILRLKFGLKKFKIKDEFRSEMKESRKQINGIMDSTRTKLDKTKETFADFKEEIVEAYQHIQKAVMKI